VSRGLKSVNLRPRLLRLDMLIGANMDALLDAI
jgi:hypothetical protein